MIMETESTSETLWGGFTSESSAYQRVKSQFVLNVCLLIKQNEKYNHPECVSNTSPCLSDDVLLHRCSKGHRSSTGPAAEAKREKT